MQLGMELVGLNFEKKFRYTIFVSIADCEKADFVITLMLEFCV